MTGSPLNEAQLIELGRSARRSRSIRRAAGVAKFNGWTLGAFAAISLLSGVWSIGGLVLGAALGVLAWGELSGGRRLVRLDPTAPVRLALNQAALCAVLVAYSGWNIWAAGRPSPELAAQAGELDSLLGPGSGDSIVRLSRQLTIAVYGALALGSVAFQGLNAWYYASRSRAMREYLAETPEWVVRAEKAVRAAS